MREHRQGLALRVQRLAAAAREMLRPQHRVDEQRLVRLGDRREAHDLPRLLRQHVPREVVLVQSVHDEDDRASELVVQSAVEGVVEPVVRRLALGLRQCLLGLQRVVDDDEVGAAPGQYAADRGGEPAALRRRVEFRHCSALRRQARREDAAVPVAGDDPPAIARQFVGEVLRIADADDLRRRVAPETPRRKRNRGEQRLQVAITSRRTPLAGPGGSGASQKFELMINCCGRSLVVVFLDFKVPPRGK